MAIANFDFAVKFASADIGYRQNGNLIADGDVIYSYGRHFAIAKLDRVRRIALVTTRYYSQSTGKHVSLVISALDRAGYRLISVPFPDDVSRSTSNWKTQIGQLNDKLRVARKPELYASQLQSIADNATGYFEHLGIPFDAELANLLRDYIDKAAYSAIRAAVIEKRREVGRAVRKWRETGQDSESLPSDRQYLRIENDALIATSVGRRLPISEAKSLYKVVLSTPIGGQGLADGYDIRRFRRMAAIGCHKIPVSEIAGIARHLGWPPIAV